MSSDGLSTTEPHQVRPDGHAHGFWTTTSFERLQAIRDGTKDPVEFLKKAEVSPKVYAIDKITRMISDGPNPVRVALDGNHHGLLLSPSQLELKAFPSSSGVCR